MMIKKFLGANAREALQKLRDELGEDAVILSTKQTPRGTEVLAALPQDIEDVKRGAAVKPQDDLSPVNWLGQVKAANPSNATQNQTVPPAYRPAASQRSESNVLATPQPDPVMEELREMRKLLQDQMAMLSWKEASERAPLRSQLWKELTDAGFSPVFSRTVVEKMPESLGEEQARRWLAEVLTHNLPVGSISEDLVDAGGVYALVGPTGVGKTTTTAKIAARCVVKYGADSLGLITTDSYRVGAQDQLRIYGKILGVQVYTANNEADLEQLLNSMSRKRLVLVDTVGMGQRDSRLQEQTDMFSHPAIKRILLLNAAAQAETLEDVARHYRGAGLHGAIITKLDEAVKLGGVLDVVIRHKLALQFITTGQRVPEDLYPAHAQVLLSRAMKAQSKGAYALSDNELKWKMAHMPASDSSVIL